MTTSQFTVRSFNPQDADGVNEAAVQAFAQFEGHYEDWPHFRAKIADTASLNNSGEGIVAVCGEAVLGAVTYVGPGRPKASFFQVEWPIMRMLVVRPSARGMGIGHALAAECIARAERDGATVFALHTSPLMSVALPMYLRMGFELHAPAPLIHGVPYNIYLKALR
jgi:GNAT superfamily N-acetyltransferase